MNAVQTPTESAAKHAPGVARAGRGRWKLIAILLVCAAPVIASYFTYYVIRPEGRTNYGALIEPMPEMSGLTLRGPDGAAADLGAVSGRWVMVVIDDGACAQACQDRLYVIRQVRLTTGKERERVERMLLVTGAAGPSPAVLQGHEGLVVRHVSAEALPAVFPSPEGDPSEHVFIVDPLGNVMMRFPSDGNASRMKKDLSKLLRASRIG